MIQYTLCIFVLLVALSLEHAIPRRKHITGSNMMVGRFRKVDISTIPDDSTASEGAQTNTNDHGIAEIVISSNNVKQRKRSVDTLKVMNVKQSNTKINSMLSGTTNNEFVNRFAGKTNQKAVSIDTNSNSNISEIQSSSNESKSTQSENATTDIQDPPSNSITDKLSDTGVEHRATNVTSNPPNLGHGQDESATTAATNMHKNETVYNTTYVEEIKQGQQASGPLVSPGISEFNTQERQSDVNVPKTANDNTTESTEIRNSTAKEAPGQQNVVLSAESLENMKKMFQQSFKKDNCSEQCSPFWLSALSLSIGQLPPNHPICRTGNYTSCASAESVCAMEPTKIICCPMECLEPIKPCYNGPEAQNMCIPIDVTHWLAKLG